MALTIGTDVMSTEDIVSNEKVVGISPRQRLLYPDMAQFLTALQKLPKFPADQSKVLWSGDESYPMMSALATSAASADTTINVTTGEGAYFRVGDCFVFTNSGEVAHITGVTADAFTVTRSFGGVSAATAATGVPIINLGKPQAQGADIDTAALYAQAASDYNYTQIFRQPVLLTGTAAEIKRFGNGEEPKAVREVLQALAKHRNRIEQSLFWGARVLDTSGSQPVGSMGGLYEFVVGIGSPATIGGALSLTAFDDAIDAAMASGTGDKAIFAGPRAAAGLINVFGNNWRPAEFGQKVYGAPVSAFLNSHYGTIPVFVKREWGLVKVPVAANKDAGQTLFLVDMGNVALRPMKNRFMKFLKDRKTTPGTDEVGYEYLSELSLEVSNLSAHAVLTGISG